jgi:hypothetical protein
VNTSSEISPFTLRLLATSLVKAPFTLSVIFWSPGVHTSPSHEYPVRVSVFTFLPSALKYLSSVGTFLSFATLISIFA